MNIPQGLRNLFSSLLPGTEVDPEVEAEQHRFRMNKKRSTPRAKARRAERKRVRAARRRNR